MKYSKSIKVVTFLIFFTLLGVGFFILKDYYQHQNNLAVESLRAKLLQECMEDKRELTKVHLEQLGLLYQKYETKKKWLVDEELQKKVQKAYEIATLLHRKYENKISKRVLKEIIKDNLSNLVYNEDENYIFITDFNGNSILKGSQNYNTQTHVMYLDADKRSIILEEIQKVRRYGEGFLQSRMDENNTTEKIYVKKLGFYDWFIGTSITAE